MDFPNAVTNPSAFFNRREELSRATSVLRADKRTPVVIVGERRIGKTSLQNVVAEEIKNDSAVRIPFFIDPRDKTSVDKLVEAILRQMSLHADRDIRQCGLFDAGGRFHLEMADQFDQAVERLLPRDWSSEFVVCIDEFDEIVRLVSAQGGGEINRLLALINHLIEKTTIRLKLFLTITRLPDPLKAEFPSPLISKAEVIELLPFSSTTSDAMIDWLVRDEQTSVQPEARSWITSLSGGHPYFIKLLVSNFCGLGEEKLPARIDLELLERVVLPRAVNDPKAKVAVDNIYKKHFSSNEKRVLLYMAIRGEPVDEQEFGLAGRGIAQALRALINRHYLVFQAGKYASQVKYLDYWLRGYAFFEDDLERLNVHHLNGVGMNDPDLDHPGEFLP